MIVYDLSCSGGHRFEGWFSSSDDFASQQRQGLVSCPHCGCAQVAKAPMAPAVPKKGNQLALSSREGEKNPSGGEPPPEVVAVLEKLAAMQAEVLKSSKWVGENFAEQSRAMYYGERQSETIHGKATPQETKELLEEGIPVAPLPFQVAPPEELN